MIPYLYMNVCGRDLTTWFLIYIWMWKAFLHCMTLDWTDWFPPKMNVRLKTMKLMSSETTTHDLYMMKDMMQLPIFLRYKTWGYYPCNMMKDVKRLPTLLWWLDMEASINYPYRKTWRLVPVTHDVWHGGKYPWSHSMQGKKRKPISLYSRQSVYFPCLYK